MECGCYQPENINNYCSANRESPMDQASKGKAHTSTIVTEPQRVIHHPETSELLVPKKAGSGGGYKSASSKREQVSK